MRVIILGARADGHAKVVLDIFDASGVTVFGFLDDDASKWGQAIRGRPILGGIDQLESLVATQQAVLSVAVFVGGYFNVAVDDTGRSPLGYPECGQVPQYGHSVSNLMPGLKHNALWLGC